LLNSSLLHDDKARRGKNDDEPGRLFVQWPDSEPIRGLAPNDVVLVVEYQSTPIRAMGNPRAITITDQNWEEFFHMALIEDAERASTDAA